MGAIQTKESKERKRIKRQACKHAKLTQDLIRSVAHSGWRRPSEAELAELQALKPCQVAALLHIRRQCIRLHRRALPILRARAGLLGFSWADVQRTLAYIREQAPVIIHVNLERFGVQLAADTHYRNLLEIACVDDRDFHSQSRKDWEDDLFGAAYQGAEAFDRCKYGVLNTTNDPQGVRCCAPVYGSSYLLLRGVRQRTTLSAEDSAGLQSSELATLDNYAHVLARYTDDELLATLEVGTQRQIGASSWTIRAYKEAQIHGEIRLKDHVEMIMAHPSSHESNSGTLERLAAHCNAPLVWMEDADASGDEADEDLRAGMAASQEDEELRIALEVSRAAQEDAAPGDGGDDPSLRLALEEESPVARCPHGASGRGLYARQAPVPQLMKRAHETALVTSL